MIDVLVLFEFAGERRKVTFLVVGCGSHSESHRLHRLHEFALTAVHPRQTFVRDPIVRMLLRVLAKDGKRILIAICLQ
jgi:hypothetical protein